jgi:signal transduction histidine kinase/CheY-like chemotaxis protein
VTLNGLNAAAIWACIGLVLAAWRIRRVERLLADPPPGLRWAQLLSALSFANLAVWGVSFADPGTAITELSFAASSLLVGAALPVAMETLAGLTRRELPGGLRFIFWFVCLGTAAAVGAIGGEGVVGRSVEAFRASYQIVWVADWVLISSSITSLFLLVVAVLAWRALSADELRTVRPFSLGAAALALALAHDQLSARNLVETPYLTPWGLWLWVIAIAVVAERLGRERITTLRQRTVEADARTGARSTFLANMSHELRTPLGGLLGLTELLLDQPRLPPRQARLAHALHRSGQRLNQLVDEVLDLEKLELGSAALVEKPFAVDELVARVVARGGHLVGTEEVEVLGDEVPVALLGAACIGDGPRLEKALLNLVANALRHTARGAVRFAVRLAAINDGIAELRFFVRDPGSRIGRPGSNLSKALRADRLSDHLADDPNLSLALALRLTELLGGRLLLQTAAGLGSTYTLAIRLPYLSPDEAPKKVPKPESPFAQPAKLLTGLRVLVVDDHPVNCLILSALVDRAGAEVLSTPSAEKTFTALEESPFDLVLMDLHMPEMDGAQTTQEIRGREAQGRFAHPGRVPIIAVSADVTAAAQQTCADAGMTGFIPKPYDRAQLYETICSVLAIRYQTSTTPLAALASGPFAELLDMVDGNHDLATEVLTEFLDRSPALLLGLDRAFEAGDHQQVALHAHTLKGSLLTLGLEDAGDAARSLEAAARAGQRDRAGEHLNALRRHLVHCEDQMRAFIDTDGEG